MRLTLLSGSGVLSFDQFRLPVNERLTIVVGPNGAGKSNMARLLTICQRAVEAADGGRGDVGRMLAAFQAAGHAGSESPQIEARIGMKLTDPGERAMVAEFVRAMVLGAITARRTVQNMAELDDWAAAEITEEKLAPLLAGEIVTSHPGTEEGQWECAWEFTAPGHDGSEQLYQWHLLGASIADAITLAGHYAQVQGSDVATRITGNASVPSGPAIEVPGQFQLISLLPHGDLSTMSCTFDLSPAPAAAQRRFAALSGLSLINSGGGRRVTLATVLRVVFRRALRQTSDTRLLPSGGRSWSSAQLTLSDSAEAGLPDMLLQLKNGDPAERARYQLIRDLFSEFTQGRACEARLTVTQAEPAGPGGETAGPSAVATTWVTVDRVSSSGNLAPEVPIEFAGAGAWEALVLASVLAETSASVVVLDEPAVALHPTLQRQLGAHLQTATAQFLVITHSAELLPLGPATDVQIVRLDRDNKSATRAWPLSETCRVKMSRKLVGKGNERLPFAWRCILGEGQDDVAAMLTLSEEMGIDLRRQNIAVVDCGSRDNIPDYVWLCAELGLRYLAVMDADASNPSARRRAQAIRDAVRDHGGGELVEFPENLEATFRVAKQNPSLVPAAIRELPFTQGVPDPASAHREVTQLAQAIGRIAGFAEPDPGGLQQASPVPQQRPATVVLADASSTLGSTT